MVGGGGVVYRFGIDSVFFLGSGVEELVDVLRVKGATESSDGVLADCDLPEAAVLVGFVGEASESLGEVDNSLVLRLDSSGLTQGEASTVCVVAVLSLEEHREEQEKK